MRTVHDKIFDVLNRIVADGHEKLPPAEFARLVATYLQAEEDPDPADQRFDARPTNPIFEPSAIMKNLI